MGTSPGSAGDGAPVRALPTAWTSSASDVAPRLRPEAGVTTFDGLAHRYEGAKICTKNNCALVDPGFSNFGGAASHIPTPDGKRQVEKYINSHGHPPWVFGLRYLVSTYIFMGTINEIFQLQHQFYKSRSQYVGLQAKVSSKPDYLASEVHLQITGSIY